MDITMKVRRIGDVAEEFQLAVQRTPQGLLVGNNQEATCLHWWYRGCSLSPGRPVFAAMEECCEICGPITVENSE